MTISTRIYAEHPDLALTHTVRALEDVTVGVLSDAGTDPSHDGHLFWVDAPDFDAVESAMTDDPTVSTFAAVDELDDRRTYRVVYSDRATLLTPGIVDVGGLTLDARTCDDGWILGLQLEDHETLVHLDEYADRHDIHFEILDLQQEADPHRQTTFGLTDAQVEALVTAYEHGYYDDPRGITLDGLSSILGISNSAVSGRLRRGSARLVEKVLVDGEAE